MIKRFIGMSVIWVFTAMAWMILSGSVSFRTHQADGTLKSRVGKLWGKPQVQTPLRLHWNRSYVDQEESTQKDDTGKEVTITKKKHRSVRVNVPLQSSRVRADVGLDHRKKGLLWYSTYSVDFEGTFGFKNLEYKEKRHTFEFQLPDPEGIYDNFQCLVNGKEVRVRSVNGRLMFSRMLAAGEEGEVFLSYRSFGQDTWMYSFQTGNDTFKVKNFELTMKTDFKEIDFPDGTMSPTSKEYDGRGWSLTWKYDNLMSGTGIGVAMPEKMNPGPFVTRVTRFAPVSLLFFFFILFIISLLKRIPLRVEHYFFLACAFFAFHLLMAYLVDHVNLYLAFFISSLVSVFLVVSYLRLVVHDRFAFREAGMSQFIYLVLFSWSFFYEGYTGLIVTVGSILTLFVVMQLTARVDLSRAS